MATTEQRIRNWANNLECKVLGPKGGPYTLIERFGEQSLLGNYVSLETLAGAVGEYADRKRREKGKRMTDEELIEAWNGEMTIPQIAQAFGVGDNWISHQWKKLRLLGKLPTGPRPRNRAKNSGRPSMTELLDRDGRPSSSDLANYDPLLERLREHHKEKMEK